HFTRFRNAAKLLLHEPTDRIVVAVGEIGVEDFGQLVDRDPSVDDDLIRADALDQRQFTIILVLNLADDLFEDVLDRHDSSGATIFVNDNGKMDLLAPQIMQQFANTFRLRHEVGWTQKLEQVHLGNIGVD